MRPRSFRGQWPVAAGDRPSRTGPDRIGDASPREQTRRTPLTDLKQPGQSDARTKVIVRSICRPPISVPAHSRRAVRCCPLRSDEGRCRGCQGAWPALTSLCRGASRGGQYGMLWCALWVPSLRCGTVAWACAVTPCGQPPSVCVAPAGAPGPMAATAPRPITTRTFRIRLSVRLAHRGAAVRRSYPRRAHTNVFLPLCLPRQLKAGRIVTSYRRSVRLPKGGGPWSRSPRDAPATTVATI